MVFLPIYYTEASLILTEANSTGYKPIFFGCDGLDGIFGVKNFNKELAEGVMLLTPFSADATDEKQYLLLKHTKNFTMMFLTSSQQMRMTVYMFLRQQLKRQVSSRMLQ